MGEGGGGREGGQRGRVQGDEGRRRRAAAGGWGWCRAVLLFPSCLLTMATSAIKMANGENRRAACRQALPSRSLTTAMPAGRGRQGNGGRGVVLVSHSMGGQVVLYYLQVGLGRR